MRTGAVTPHILLHDVHRGTVAGSAVEERRIPKGLRQPRQDILSAFSGAKFELEVAPAIVRAHKQADRATARTEQIFEVINRIALMLVRDDESIRLLVIPQLESHHKRGTSLGRSDAPQVGHQACGSVFPVDPHGRNGGVPGGTALVLTPR